MTKRPLPIVSVKLDKIVGGGQALATLDDGRKLFVWGGLPGETVQVQITKKKSKLAEGVVVEATNQPGLNPGRTQPRDLESYLSTSPWQIMTFDAEQHYKSALIEEAFELHGIVLPEPIQVFSDNKQYEYRNKIEFSWWWNRHDSHKIPTLSDTPSPSKSHFSVVDEPTGSPPPDKMPLELALKVSEKCEVSCVPCTKTEQLDLAFFRRGTHGKIPVNGTSLAHPNINQAAIKLRDLLRTFTVNRTDFHAFILKTVLIRCNADGNVAMQLYVKDPDFAPLSEDEIKSLGIDGFELIFSNPQSPASTITKRLQSWGATNLTDIVLDIPFTYAVESFFQINIPVYAQALRDMKKWVSVDKPTVDLYSGVGTIGLTIGGENVTMIEINEQAVHEMKRNIRALGREKTVRAILASSESSTEYITSDSTVIVDPPRAGLHKNVISRLLETVPERIIYLSCNPVTQARDIALLAEKYGIRYHRGYNFFPRTPHIEHLVVLDLKK